MPRHLFVCTNTRAAGKPACGERGGAAVLRAVHRLLVERGADPAAARATACGCLGPCFDGPNAVLYPDGAWYAGLSPDDAPGLVAHLLGGAPLAARLAPAPGALDADEDDR